MDETIRLLVARDRVFGVILDLYGPPAFRAREEGFESMCRIILEQQVSLESAKASFYKLKDISPDGTLSPARVYNYTDEEFRVCGISRQKTTYLRGLAQAISDGSVDFSSFRSKDPTHVRKEMMKLKGIGNWTVDIYLMFSLQSPDILPLGDIGIISVMKELWGLETPEQMNAHAQKWAPYRTTAAFLLWHYYLCRRNRTFPV